MVLHRFFISLTLLTSTTLSLFEPDPDSISTVYETLSSYGLPSGLLPDSVTNFTLSDDGRFVVHLTKPCYIEFDYLVYYDKTISGRIGYGSITDLKGIQVKRLFFWFDVDEIKVDLPPSDSIYFKVGIINKKLEIDQFKTVHSCRDNGVSGSCGDSWKSFLEQRQGMMDEAAMLITESATTQVWSRVSVKFVQKITRIRRQVFMTFGMKCTIMRCSQGRS